MKSIFVHKMSHVFLAVILISIALPSSPELWSKDTEEVQLQRLPQPQLQPEPQPQSQPQPQPHPQLHPLPSEFSPISGDKQTDSTVQHAVFGGETIKTATAPDSTAPTETPKHTGTPDINVPPPEKKNNKPGIFYKNKVAVLTYHHIASTESAITISPERLHSHLQALKDNGFNIISVEDLIQFLENKAKVPPNAVVITFDDGYDSAFEFAFPLLKAEGMTATFFLIVNYVGDGVVRKPAILNWDEIDEMHRDGFSFYSHTYNMHKAVKNDKGKEVSLLATKVMNESTNLMETDEEYEQRIEGDLAKANEILNAKLNNKLNLLCLPHGQYNQTVIKAAKEAGITYLFTGVYGLNNPKDKLIKRMNAGSPYVTSEQLIKLLARAK